MSDGWGIGSESLDDAYGSSDNNSSSDEEDRLERVDDGRPREGAARYELMSKIGRGAYGCVFKAWDHVLQIEVAVKVINLEDTGEELDDVHEEIHVMSQLNCPQLVRYHCSFIVADKLWIVMSYFDCGSLNFMLKETGPLPETVIAYIMHELLSGLVYLHEQRMIHRDVKAGNLLLDSSGKVTLADFGVAGRLTDTIDKRKSRVGTPFWMAPEVITQSSYDGCADIWSAGITAIELAMGAAPYAGQIHPVQVLFLIPKVPPPELKGAFSDDFKDFVRCCLKMNPRERSTAAQLLVHPFIMSGSCKPLDMDVLMVTMKSKLQEKNPSYSQYRFGLQQGDAGVANLGTGSARELEGLGLQRVMSEESGWDMSQCTTFRGASVSLDDSYDFEHSYSYTGTQPRQQQQLGDAINYSAGSAGGGGMTGRTLGPSALQRSRSATVFASGMRAASMDAGHMPSEGHGGISISVSSNGAGVRSDRMSPLLPEDEATLVLDRATPYTRLSRSQSGSHLASKLGSVSLGYVASEMHPAANANPDLLSLSYGADNNVHASNNNRNTTGALGGRGIHIGNRATRGRGGHNPGVAGLDGAALGSGGVFPGAYMQSRAADQKWQELNAIGDRRAPGGPLGIAQGEPSLPSPRLFDPANHPHSPGSRESATSLPPVPPGSSLLWAADGRSSPSRPPFAPGKASSVPSGYYTLATASGESLSSVSGDVEGASAFSSVGAAKNVSENWLNPTSPRDSAVNTRPPLTHTGLMPGADTGVDADIFGLGSPGGSLRGGGGGRYDSFGAAPGGVGPPALGDRAKTMDFTSHLGVSSPGRRSADDRKDDGMNDDANISKGHTTNTNPGQAANPNRNVISYVGGAVGGALLGVASLAIESVWRTSQPEEASVGPVPKTIKATSINTNTTATDANVNDASTATNVSNLSSAISDVGANDSKERVPMPVSPISKVVGAGRGPTNTSTSSSGSNSSAGVDTSNSDTNTSSNIDYAAYSLMHVSDSMASSTIMNADTRTNANSNDESSLAGQLVRAGDSQEFENSLEREMAAGQGPAAGVLGFEHDDDFEAGGSPDSSFVAELAVLDGTLGSASTAAATVGNTSLADLADADREDVYASSDGRHNAGVAGADDVYPTVLGVLRSPPDGARLSPAFDRFLRPALQSLTNRAHGQPFTATVNSNSGGPSESEREAALTMLIASISALDLLDPEATQQFVRAIVDREANRNTTYPNSNPL